MAVGTAHVLHGIVLPTSTVISQISDGGPELNIEEMTGYAAGVAQPLFTSIQMQKTEVPFTSPMIATVLGAMTVNSISADLSAGNTDLYFKKMTDLAWRVADASAAHIRARMAQAFMCWTRIEATQGQDATIQVRLIPTWDGTNQPVVFAGSTALAGTSTGAQFFTLGPVKLQGAFLTGIRSWSLDLGIDVMLEGADGDTLPTFAAVRSIKPVLTIRGIDSTWLTSFAPAGTAISGCIAYLRKKQADLTNYSDASTEHVKIVGNGGIILPDNSKAGDNKEAETSLRIALRAASGTTNALTITTGEAIA